MALSHDVQNRLYNYKFGKAKAALDAMPNEATEREKELIEALAATFDNPGWFSGYMNTIVDCALNSIGVQPW